MKYFIAVLVSFSLFACNTTNSSGEQTDTTDSEEVVDTKERFVRAKYAAATVYAAATDYRFITDEGEEIIIRVSHIEPEGNPEITVNLTNVMEELDGPPEADPALVGKYFKLHQDSEGKYTKIEKE